LFTLGLKAGTTDGHEKPLASGEEEWRQSLPMATVAPAPGEVIGDYEILERIGGNMGLVYKAHQRRLKKVVALKLLRADSISDPELVARFEREIEVLGQLNHPNLVAAADARRVDGWLLVAMEWIEGLDLYQMVQFHGPLPIADASEAAREAALGLQHCHERGLVHRDIKPSNLMLTREGRIKVIDLGLALPLGDDVQQLTQAGHVMGTLGYCAPEQFRDASHVDIRADIYSLGCTLYHLLAGKSPYWQRKTPTEAMQAHLNEPFPSLCEVRPDAPAELEALVVRMTAKDPEARFSTPREVAEALESFARGAELKKFLPAKFQQDLLSPVTLPKRPPTTSGQRPKARLSRRAALFLGVPTAVGGAFLFGKLGAPDDSSDEEKLHKWQVLYDLLDDKLACFMGNVGTISPNTKFLIYSRGTDINWNSPDFRERWVKEIEARFPGLKDRISTMEITKPSRRERATFQNPETADEMRKRVKVILGLPERNSTPTPPNTPVVVLMDTTADRGVYDDENKGTRITNAEVLQKQLQDLPLGGIHVVPISVESSKRDWRGEDRVLRYRPSLVIIHRSGFFHPVNAELGLGYPPPPSGPQKSWQKK
jgi:serine/threonine protein kinase